MTREEVRKFAMENYNNGGDVIIECWEDKDIDEFLKTANNPKRELVYMFGVWEEERRF